MKVSFVVLEECRCSVDELVCVYIRAYSEHEIAKYGELGCSAARRYLEWLVGHSTFFCVALVEGQPVGFIVADARWVDHRGRCGEIHEWVVLPEYRQRKIGKKLFERAVEHLRQKGMNRIGLWVGEGNQRAFNIYNKMGFKVTGRWGEWVRLEKQLTAPS